MTKKVVDKGYQPFVVIRPENDASQSLYKKLGFKRLYQTVRMSFMPSTWQDEETKMNRVLRENLENAVRQLTIEQKVADAFRNEEMISIAEETIEGKEQMSECLNETGNLLVEEPEEGSEEDENPLGEETEERIIVTELSVEGNVEVESADNTAETANGSNQDDGGTNTGDAE